MEDEKKMDLGPLLEFFNRIGETCCGLAGFIVFAVAVFLYLYFKKRKVD